MITYRIASSVGKSDLLVLPLFAEKTLESGVKQLDNQLGGLISSVKEREDFAAKKGQQLLLQTTDADMPRILLVGLGEKKKLRVRSLKQAIGAATIQAQGKKAKAVSVMVGAGLLKQVATKTLFQELSIAIELANYAFDEHKDKEARVQSLEAVDFIAELDAKQRKAAEQGLEDGTHIGTATNFTRYLGNTPPSIMTPTLLAKEMTKVVDKTPGLSIEVLSKPDIKKLGMGCFLGVAQGSVEAPKFIIVNYNGGKKDEKPSVLVGKGITFDSGGLSLKPGSYMPDMKFDMLGAATALGSIYAAALLKVKKNIVALVPSCENMPSGESYRPDDILTAMNGRTVHIDNTDAEGRLILSDALCYAHRYEPKEVIDFATLTGACMVALGNERSGLFSKQDKMVSKLEAASEQVGEQLWHLPLGEEYSDAMKSEVADYKNLGAVPKSGYGGASTAAAFLEFFTLNDEGKAGYPWAHVDLSCSYYGGKGKPWIRVGANGFGVQTMVQYLR